MDRGIKVNIESSFLVFVKADADSFGAMFAKMNDFEQVAVLAAMVEHMEPHSMQWDYISIELEKPENSKIRDTLREVLFPST